MISHLILACLAICIFIIYNAAFSSIFGLPASLSATFYVLNEKRPNLGWLFSAMMWVVCGLLIVPWIEVTLAISYWSEYFTILPFASIVSLLFVATAPNFRDGGLPLEVHMTCAKASGVFAILWVLIVCWKIMYVVPIWILLCGAIAYLTNTAKSSSDWWTEMIAFGSTFTAILVELILSI